MYFSSQEITATGSQHISEFASEMLELSNETQKKVIGIFNGTSLIIYPDMGVNVEQIIELYEKNVQL